METPLPIGALNFDFRRERMMISPAFEIRVWQENSVVERVLLDIGKESAEGVEILLCDWVELVVMAFRAADGGAEPCAANGADPVGHVLGQVFLGLNAALPGHHAQPVESGGDPLGGSWIRQKVPGNLFEGEPVEGEVLVECVDDVIPVREDPLVLVPVKSHGVGKADGIQPPGGPAFAKARGVEEPFGAGLQSGICVRRPEILWRRGNAGQVEAQSA